MIKTHQFNGKRYKLFFSADADGSCDSPLGKAERTIEVNVPLNTKRGLQVLLHECLHAEDWRKSEEAVNRTANEIGELIWRLIKSGQLA